MIKIAMIGAGSVTFSQRLTGDILSYPEFKDATLTYMDIDEERLQVGAALCRKMAKAMGANATIETTLDRRAALKDADFVITMLLVGGFDSVLADFEIPRRFGVRQTIADTVGPAAVMKALRLYPVLSGIARDMEELCPRAVLLNYSNPMSMNMLSVFRTSGIRAVGLCHSIQGSYGELMRYLRQDPERCTFVAGGINHMSVFTRLERDGVDLYPALFAAMEDPRISRENPVRFELMRRFGCFPTESSTHHAEYGPYFLHHGEARRAQFGVTVDSYLLAYPRMLDDWERMKAQARSEEPMPVCRSHEYGSEIIHSMVTGQPRVVYGNMPNSGAIDNLPRAAIVEAPTLVDRSGLRFGHIGEIPPQWVGYVSPHVAVHELFIRAAQQGRRDHLYQAAMLDPNTAASATTDEIVAMCDQLIAAHQRWLPPLAKRTLVAGAAAASVAAPGTDYASLRAAWEAENRRAAAEFLATWQAIGPFPSVDGPLVTLDEATPVDAVIRAGWDGAIDRALSHRAGTASCAWRAVPVDRHGYLDLQRGLGRTQEWDDGAIAYAYAEFVHAGGAAALRCGGHDGIRVWLNGAQVHTLELCRDFNPGDARIPVTLRPGVNRLLVKCYSHSWRWGLQVGVAAATGAAAAAAAASASAHATTAAAR